jgi:PleD family two-component response regulator
MPGKLTRSKSYGSPEHLRGSLEGLPGSELVTDNKTMLKAVRMPDEFAETSQEEAPSHVASKVLFDLPDDQAQITEKLRNAEHLQVLVAEDDPVNSRIIQKRLEKSGHDVHHTVNGEDCASVYGEKPAFFDVVLMDMQVSCIYFLIFISQMP